MAALVLIVDDHPDDATLARTTLAERGFAIEVVTTSMAARITLERRPPAVILLDVESEEGKGMELLDHIKANLTYAAIPVVVITRRASDDDILAIYKFGADYVLGKPFTARRLLHAVGLALGRDFAT